VNGFVVWKGPCLQVDVHPFIQGRGQAGFRQTVLLGRGKKTKVPLGRTKGVNGRWKGRVWGRGKKGGFLGLGPVGG